MQTPVRQLTFAIGSGQEAQGSIKVLLAFISEHDNLRTRLPTTTALECRKKNELGVVARLKNPSMNLARSHMEQRASGEFDLDKVDLVASATIATPDQEFEIYALGIFELRQRLSGQKARQRERLDR